MNRLLRDEEDLTLATNLGDLHLSVSLAFHMGEGRLREAEALFREALTMRTNLPGASNPLVAGTAVDRGQVLTEQGRYGEAEAH